MALEGMDINFLSRTITAVHVANSLLKELSKSGIHYHQLLTLLQCPHLDRASWVWIFLHSWRFFNFLLCMVLSFCCRPFYCFHFRHLYLFYNCLSKFCVYHKGSHKCTCSAWLSCSSRLDARIVSMLDVLWANKWLIDWLTVGVDLLDSVMGNAFWNNEVPDLFKSSLRVTIGLSLEKLHLYSHVSTLNKASIVPASAADANTPQEQSIQ